MNYFSPQASPVGSDGESEDEMVANSQTGSEEDSDEVMMDSDEDEDLYDPEIAHIDLCNPTTLSETVVDDCFSNFRSQLGYGGVPPSSPLRL